MNSYYFQKFCKRYFHQKRNATQELQRPPRTLVKLDMSKKKITFLNQNMWEIKAGIKPSHQETQLS